MKITIGHPAYGGVNRYALHTDLREAAQDLIRRGVDPKEARRIVLRPAISYSCTIWTTEGVIEIGVNPIPISRPNNPTYSSVKY